MKTPIAAVIAAEIASKRAKQRIKPEWITLEPRKFYDGWSIWSVHYWIPGVVDPGKCLIPITITDAMHAEFDGWWVERLLEPTR